MVPTVAGANLWGKARGVTVDQAWYGEHVDELVVLVNGLLLVGLVLVVGGVGGVVRLLRVLRQGPGSAKP